MKTPGCTAGLIALCAMKASLVWHIWLGVMATLAVIGAARMLGAGCKTTRQ